MRTVFDLEDWAQIGSTFILSLLVILAAPLLYRSGREFWWVLIPSGCVGLVSSFFISKTFDKKMTILKNAKTNGT